MGLGLGPFEIILIFAIMLLMFGAKRLPELAGGMGKGIRDFKRALNGADDPQLPPPAHPGAEVVAPAAVPVSLPVEQARHD